jgi:hypothetical protein
MTSIRKRGKSKKGAMVHMTIRLPKDVADYYKQFASPATVMRMVLAAKFQEEKETTKDTPESV